MGTTVVAVLVTGDQAALVGVGDSRIYRFRNGQLEQLTSDDTWLSAVIGVSDDDRANSNHPLQHVLTSVVGTREDLRPDAREEQLLPGDRLILCSDGIHGRLDTAAIADVVRAGGTAEQLASALVDEALAAADQRQRHRPGDCRGLSSRIRLASRNAPAAARPSYNYGDRRCA